MQTCGAVTATLSQWVSRPPLFLPPGGSAFSGLCSISDLQMLEITVQVQASLSQSLYPPQARPGPYNRQISVSNRLVALAPAHVAWPWFFSFVSPVSTDFSGPRATQ